MSLSYNNHYKMNFITVHPPWTEMDPRNAQIIRMFLVPVLSIVAVAMVLLLFILCVLNCNCKTKKTTASQASNSSPRSTAPREVGPVNHVPLLPRVNEGEERPPSASSTLKKSRTNLRYLSARPASPCHNEYEPPPDSKPRRDRFNNHGINPDEINATRACLRSTPPRCSRPRRFQRASPYSNVPLRSSTRSRVHEERRRRASTGLLYSGSCNATNHQQSPQLCRDAPNTFTVIQNPMNGVELLDVLALCRLQDVPLSSPSPIQPN